MRVAGRGYRDGVRSLDILISRQTLRYATLYGEIKTHYWKKNSLTLIFNSKQVHEQQCIKVTQRSIVRDPRGQNLRGVDMGWYTFLMLLFS